MSNKQSHAGEQHPPEWRQDLNPDPQAGQNHGQAHTYREDGKTAYEHKAAHQWLADFTDDELRTIPIVPAGMHLQQGAVYIDLRSHDRGEFKARGDMSAEEHNVYVAKSDVDYQLWNRLIGVNNPQRTGESDEV
jgi:hypothetical protein